MEYELNIFRISDMFLMLQKVKMGTESQKIKAFEKVCREIKPVFRYFFVEKFPLPTMWFERKLAYTHR